MRMRTLHLKWMACLLSVSLLLTSCQKKNYLDRANEDKALADAIKQLNKDETDSKALDAIPVLYARIRENRLSAIESSRNSRDLGRWDKIISHYEALQEAYDAINSSPAARKLVSADNVSETLISEKQQAAAAYYEAGIDNLDRGGRDLTRKAYNYFKKADRFVPNYKDSRHKMEEAFGLAMVKVLVNPVQDNSFFVNNGWGWGPGYSQEYFQQTLLRELNNLGDRFPAKFYAHWEVSRDRIDANWVIDLVLRNMEVPQPFSRQYTRRVSKQVQVGTDTSGRPVYDNVSATLYITRMSFTAQANMEVRVVDFNNNKNIGYRNFREEYRWEEERARYTGNSQALSPSDWQLINRNSFNTPRQEDIVRELYRRLYPSVKNYIRQVSDW